MVRLAWLVLLGVALSVDARKPRYFCHNNTFGDVVLGLTGYREFNAEGNIAFRIANTPKFVTGPYHAALGGNFAFFNTLTLPTELHYTLKDNSPVVPTQYGIMWGRCWKGFAHRLKWSCGKDTGSTDLQFIKPSYSSETVFTAWVATPKGGSRSGPKEICAMTNPGYHGTIEQACYSTAQYQKKDEGKAFIYDVFVFFGSPNENYYTTVCYYDFSKAGNAIRVCDSTLGKLYLDPSYEEGATDWLPGSGESLVMLVDSGNGPNAAHLQITDSTTLQLTMISKSGTAMRPAYWQTLGSSFYWFTWIERAQNGSLVYKIKSHYPGDVTSAIITEPHESVKVLDNMPLISQDYNSQSVVTLRKNGGLEFLFMNFTDLAVDKTIKHKTGCHNRLSHVISGDTHKEWMFVCSDRPGQSEFCGGAYPGDNLEPFRPPAPFTPPNPAHMPYPPPQRLHADQAQLIPEIIQEE